MSRRRPEVTETRLPAEGRVHPPGCNCAQDECVGRSIKLDVSAVDAPGLVRCDGDVDGDVAAARKGGA